MRERRNSKALRRSTRRWRSIELCWERFSQLSSESDPARDPLDLRGDLPEDPPSLESVAADRGLFCLEGSDELFRDETSDLTDLVVEAATANWSCCLTRADGCDGSVLRDGITWAKLGVDTNEKNEKTRYFHCKIEKETESYDPPLSLSLIGALTTALLFAEEDGVEGWTTDGVGGVGLGVIRRTSPRETTSISSSK